MDWASWLLVIVLAGATFLFYFIFRQRGKWKEMNMLQRWKEWQRRTVHREQGQKAHKEVEDETGKRQD